MTDLSKYKIQDFRNEILNRNILHKKMVIQKLKEQYKDIFIVTEHNSGYGRGKYKYDFVWLDGIYNDKNFRICFYSQDIDSKSYNIHIFHDTYTFQKNLVKNLHGPYSIFNINLGCKESFNQAIDNMKLSKYGVDNFDLDKFINEFLYFIKYKEIKK